MTNLSSGGESPGSPLLHQAFLERASDTSAAGSGDLALGAFLTLRMVDQFGASARPNKDALGYQVRATQDFVQNLPGESPELNHLRQIARVGAQVLKKNEPRFLWSPMLAYAFWLEQDLRLAEAVDVLDTALGLGGDTDCEEQVATHLQRGRVLRLVGHFDASTGAYGVAGEIALRLGDQHSYRRSRLGRAVVAQKLGNLAGSEHALREVIAESQVAEDRDMEAHSLHELAITLEHMGRVPEGIAVAFRAFELYEQSEDRLKALQVVGVSMKIIGNYPAAENAFAVVMANDPVPEFRQNTMLELLDVAALTGDRVAFERWRRELESQRSTLPPDAYVDFDTKLGQGYALFGQPERAREALRNAVRRAEQHKLNKYLFRAESLLHELDQAQAHERQRAPIAVATAHVTDVDDVAEKLELLRASD